MARNRFLVPGVQNALNQFKNEVAEEVGLHNYDSLDKGWIPARCHGYVGGNVTKKLISYAESVMASQGSQAISQATANVIEIPEEVYQLNQQASQNMGNFQQALANIQHGQHNQNFIQ